MSRSIAVHEAPAHLATLLDEVARGHEFLVEGGGEAMAKLVPYMSEVGPRGPGGWRGKIWISPDFDEPLPAGIEAAFRGEAP